MNKGIITTYVLVFGALFLLLLSGLLGFILQQLRQADQLVAFDEALHIAEAGMNYYRWCFNNEAEQNCFLEKDFFDSSGAKIGAFSMQVNSTIGCGQITQRQFISTGWTQKYPQLKRTVSALYARPSVAEYSYILNDNVWIGQDHEIRGPYQSNGGVRMDGENQSLVSSAQNEWVCTSSFGCSTCPVSAGCSIEGSNCMCPGVFTTANGNDDLFQFPVPPFNFSGITIDLAAMKASSQSAGVYLPPSADLDPQGRGYHLIFNNNGTFDVFVITGLSPTSAYSLEEGWHDDYFTITSEYFYQNFVIPSSCSAIFVEDNIWPEGQIRGKVTVASANLINPNLDTDVVLPANIEYTALDGSDGLVLLGERNVLIGPQSPNQMELRGVFIAQKGRFSRNHYPNNIKDKLEISGSIVSNGRVGTQWVSGSQVVSGYLQRESYFDDKLIFNAPPFIPYSSSDFKIINWEELD